MDFSVYVGKSVAISINYVDIESGGEMATYKQIQDYVKENNGYVPKTCWIAHVKELCGLNPQVAVNRHSTNRTILCP